MSAVSGSIDSKASVRAVVTHAVYLARVATWLDHAALDDPLHAAAPLDLRQVAYLVDSLGIDPCAVLADGDGAGWPLFCARIERIGRLFRFATEPGEGVPTVLIVARSFAGEGIELVAWSAREGWIASETGTLALLGTEWLCPLSDDPIEVHAGALEWLRNGRRGVVVVNQRRATPILREATSIVVSDVDLGIRLQQALTVKAPPIRVREAA